MLLSNAGFSITSWKFRPITSGEKEGGGFLCSFLKIEKTCLDFAKNVPLFWKNVPCWCASMGQIFI